MMSNDGKGQPVNRRDHEQLLEERDEKDRRERDRLDIELYGKETNGPHLMMSAV